MVTAPLTDEQKNTVAGILTSTMGYALARGVSTDQLRQIVGYALEFSCAYNDTGSLQEATFAAEKFKSGRR